MRPRSFTLVALVLLSCSAAPAQVRYPPAGRPGSRPTTSPYLNLRRPGVPAINYYNLVRPEFEFRNAYQGLRQDVGFQQAEIREVAEAELPATGHTSRFLNFSHFYPSYGAGQGVGRAPGTAATVPRPTGPTGASRPTSPGPRR
jgi:hypothetical protein